MAYKLTIVQKPTYLHAIVTGRNSKGNVERYLEEVHSACVARDCFTVLIEERLEGPRLETLDVFDIASQGSIRNRTVPMLIAYVDVNAEGNLMKFAENVAVNRGLRVTVLRTVAEAERWLSNSERGGIQQ